MWSNRANGHSALFYAIVGTAVYVLVLVVLHGELTDLPGKIAEQANLNLLGDSVGGLTAPVALIWLVAAVVTQSQELKLTKDELAKTAGAMDEQVRLMREQSEVQKSVAIATYKVNLFQERFALYQFLNEYVDSLYGNVRFDTVQDVRKHIQQIRFVYGPKVYDQGSEFFRLILSLRNNLEYYENTFGGYPFRNDDGELTFFQNGPEHEQEARVYEIDAQLSQLVEEMKYGRLILAMRAALELDSDIDLGADQRQNNATSETQTTM